MTHPIATAENAVINALLYPNLAGTKSQSGKSNGSRPNGPPRPRTSAPTDRATTPPNPAAPRTRADIAAESQTVLDNLFAVETFRYPSIVRPVIPLPVPVDASTVIAQQWPIRKVAVPFWRRAGRRALRAQVEAEISAELDRQHRAARGVAVAKQQEADRWWSALNNGDPATVTGCLSAAFSATGFRIHVTAADARSAMLVMTVPGPEILPQLMPHVTPTGRLSCKKWPTTELNAAFARLLGGHLIAATRQAWASAPALQQIEVIGLRVPGEATSVYFDIRITRSEWDWNRDSTGATLLHTSTTGLNRVGTAARIEPLPSSSLTREVLEAVQRAS